MSDRDIEPVLANYQIDEEPEVKEEGSENSGESYLNAETVAMGGALAPLSASATGSVLGGGHGCWVGNLLNAAAVATIIVLTGLIIVMIWRWATESSGGGGSGLSSGPMPGAQNNSAPPPPYAVAIRRRPDWDTRWGQDNRDGRNNFDREMDHYPDVQWSGRMPRPHFLPS